MFKEDGQTRCHALFDVRTLALEAAAPKRTGNCYEACVLSRVRVSLLSQKSLLTGKLEPCLACLQLLTLVHVVCPWTVVDSFP